jgi:hypothetical protein
MGMFDYVICEYKLPLPKDCKELADVNWNEYTFQSKDMNCLMDDYKINKKGKLLVTSGRPDFFDEPPVDLPETESSYHGELNFHAYEQRNKYDYSVGFNAKFSYGKLDAIELTEFEKHSNEKRKSYQADFKKQAELYQTRKTKLWYKVYRTFYAKPIKYLFRTMYKVLSHIKSNWFMYESKLLPW